MVFELCGLIRLQRQLGTFLVGYDVFLWSLLLIIKR